MTQKNNIKKSKTHNPKLLKLLKIKEKNYQNNFNKEFLKLKIPQINNLKLELKSNKNTKH